MLTYDVERCYVSIVLTKTASCTSRVWCNVLDKAREPT